MLKVQEGFSVDVMCVTMADPDKGWVEMEQITTVEMFIDNNVLDSKK